MKIKALSKLIADFAKKNPDAKVQMVTMQNWGGGEEETYDEICFIRASYLPDGTLFHVKLSAEGVG